MARPATGAILFAAVATTGVAQTLPREDCSSAGSSIRIRATRGRGGAPGAVTYAVINNRRESLQWIRIGVGGGAFTVIVPEKTPVIVQTPSNWRGVVVRQEESGRVHFSWEAADEGAELISRSRTEFGIRGREAYIVRPDLPPIDLTSLPFSAGSRSGACWWGRTTDPSGPPEGGYFAGFTGASVRTIAGAGKDYVIVDAPSYDGLMRFGRRPVFLTIPLALSWGVKGGFSHDASIGIGLSWSPSKYVSTFAKASFGTFFFNNRTHLRTIGIDINIPIGRTTLAEGLTPQSKYLVFGAEYFHRDVVKWRGFLKEPQWYASGHGVAIRVGIRRLSWSSY